MSNFPLYDTLSTDLSDKDLTVLQKKKFIARVSKLNTEASELIYALILTYYNVNTQGDNLTIPYKGKLHTSGLEFNLLNLPVKLRQLLFKFVTIHQEKVKEDEEIEAHKNTLGTLSEEQV